MDQLITPATPANPATIYNAVSTHLRPRRSSRAIRLLLTLSGPLTPQNTTILERRLQRQVLLDAQITPKARCIPSLYYNPTALLLYVFNHDFYNNKDIINGDVSFEDTVFGC
jgi:hypothetical protein